MANDEPAEQTEGSSSTEDASLSAIDFSGFLTNSTSLPSVNFRAASGINVTGVAEALIGIAAFTVTWAASGLLDSVIAAPARILDWLSRFARDLLQVTIGVGVTGVKGVWTFALDELGAFAYLGGVLVVLATFYVASWGADTAREVL